ncbi:MAG TPA: hypothetical protein VEM76_21035 [Anaeromyxobacteraceae bacterium]|nr:hypothetical protein [Anaeromyxobacteraceae bacterium]
MSHDVECTHCHVLMTTWSAAGSPVRYWQCPFCNRTHSSLYSEVFQRGAGARRVDPSQGSTCAQAAGAPQATPQDIAWTRLKARAARWFARLEQEQVPTPPAAPTSRALPATPPRGAGAPLVPALSPAGSGGGRSRDRGARSFGLATVITSARRRR